MKGKAGPGFREQVAAEAKKQGLKTERPEGVDDEKPPIPAGNSPIQPKAVRDGQIMANYVKPHYLLKKDKRTVGLEMSFPLTDDHRDILPKSVCDEWKHLQRSTSMRIVNIEVVPQTVDVRFAPEMEAEIHIHAARITRATLAVIQEKGTGAAKKVIRFSFQIVSEVSKNICSFADNDFGKVVWIEMGPTQGELEEDDDE